VIQLRRDGVPVEDRDDGRSNVITNGVPKFLKEEGVHSVRAWCLMRVHLIQGGPLHHECRGYIRNYLWNR